MSSSVSVCSFLAGVLFSPEADRRDRREGLPMLQADLSPTPTQQPPSMASSTTRLPPPELGNLHIAAAGGTVSIDEMGWAEALRVRMLKSRDSK